MHKREEDREPVARGKNSYLFLITLAIIESEAPGRENLADCPKDDQFVYSFCIDIEMSD
jgi:hypothetical protein